jgi:nucleoside 2-deoxyribosyltransferase
MAMKFRDAELNGVLETCFKPAAAAAGFSLRTVADEQPAGLIDDQMRVGLRQARFVIADLTHASRGAYWEAGFAEGAGKPVIYTCRADLWTSENPHFDTNHLATIIWDLANLDEAKARLTAMIRATLPAEAKLEA